RGVGLRGESRDVSFRGILGATSTGLATPFMRTGTTDRGFGAFFFDWKRNERWTWFSRNIISSRISLINGVEWKPSPRTRAAIAGGIGANHGYSALSFDTDREWIAVKAGYVGAGDGFRRIVVATPINVEPVKENIQVVLRPKPYLRVNVGRQNFLSPMLDGQPAVRGTVNQIGTSLTAAGFVVAGRWFAGRSEQARSRGASFLVKRAITRRVEVSTNLLSSGPAGGPKTTSLIATTREKISPRLSLLQVISRSGGRSTGQTTFSFGGNLYSNLLMLGVQYQTFFVPFQPQEPFRQALMLNLRVRLPANFQVQAGTHVLPDGRVRYTTHGTGFVYSGMDGRGSAGQAAFPKFLIQGWVGDEQGRPVRGAAVRVDGELLFTDSEGRFFIRKKKSRSYSLEVALEEFLAAGLFEVVSAPAAVRALPDEAASEAEIVLRRARRK
ncbi:MAG: hypothetical protein O6850_07955, partial [Acidobacteria bacterium]|nr:hypothetical protein [Acidobacteriota bacterium]